MGDVSASSPASQARSAEERVVEFEAQLAALTVERDTLRLAYRNAQQGKQKNAIGLVDIVIFGTGDKKYMTLTNDKKFLDAAPFQGVALLKEKKAWLVFSPISYKGE